MAHGSIEVSPRKHGSLRVKGRRCRLSAPLLVLALAGSSLLASACLGGSSPSSSPAREATPTPAREATPTPAREATPTPGAQATPTPAVTSGAPRTAADCVAPPGVPTVATIDVATDRGVADPRLYMVRWTTTMANTGGTAVGVAVHRTSSDGTSVKEEWTTYRVPSGQTTTFPGWMSNNAGAEPGPPQWDYVDSYIATLPTEGCMSLLQDPTQLPSTAAITVEHPPTP